MANNNKNNAQLEFEKWDQPARSNQIALVSFLTALLYLGFSFIETPWMPDHFKKIATQFHFYLIAPMLFLISFLAYKNISHRILLPCLAITPIIAMTAHIYIVSRLKDNTIFLTEGYFVILWIFIVSGLRFKYAVVTASIVAFMLIASGYSILLNSEMYPMYVYWIVCSFSFGFLGAFLYRESRVSTFISQQKLQELAVTDTLTGLFNRSVFNQVVTKKLSDNHVESSFALVIIDIDHFKKVNDTLGHEVGDKVIQKVAKNLSKINQDHNTLVRWGGEEFVIIADDITSKALNKLCHEICAKIESLPFPPFGQITVSVGATLSTEIDTQDSLLIRADNALYQAKKEGRNRFVIIN